MAAVGLGNTTQNLCCLSIVLGFNGALDTLVSQAAGQAKYELCGVYRNRGIVVVTLLFIPISAILINCDKILITFGQHKEVAAYTQ